MLRSLLLAILLSASVHCHAVQKLILQFEEAHALCLPAFSQLIDQLDEMGVEYEIVFQPGGVDALQVVFSEWDVQEAIVDDGYFTRKVIKAWLNADYREQCGVHLRDVGEDGGWQQAHLTGGVDRSAFQSTG